jgi:hypothetical protein
MRRTLEQMLDIGGMCRRSLDILVYDLDLKLEELMKLHGNGFSLLGRLESRDDPVELAAAMVLALPVVRDDGSVRGTEVTYDKAMVAVWEVRFERQCEVAPADAVEIWEDDVAYVGIHAKHKPRRGARAAAEPELDTGQSVQAVIRTLQRGWFPHVPAQVGLGQWGPGRQGSAAPEDRLPRITFRYGGLVQGIYPGNQVCVRHGENLKTRVE